VKNVVWPLVDSSAMPFFDDAQCVSPEDGSATAITLCNVFNGG